ncbi:MAG: hypothetical protein ACLR02_11290 [Clostridium sp.]
MSDVMKIMEFTKEHPKVNLKLLNDSEEVYDFAILFLYCCEAKRGFGVKKIYKTNRAGTKVCYRAFENNEEVQKYVKMVKNKIKEFNQKWHGDYIR